jgi:hypothetical protein
MSLALPLAGKLSLSVELPLLDESAGLSQASLLTTLQRLQAVQSRMQVPVTWVWSGAPPTKNAEYDALGATAQCDLGWWPSTMEGGRTFYRAQFIQWLKQWSQAQQATGQNLALVVNGGNKVSTPYDALANCGVSILRDVQATSTTNLPRTSATGLCQMPVAQQLTLSAGWINSTRAVWGLQTLLKKLEENPRLTLHIRIDAHSQHELGASALANWERILNTINQSRQRGVQIVLARETLAASNSTNKRHLNSILRVA